MFITNTITIIKYVLELVQFKYSPLFNISSIFWLIVENLNIPKNNIVFVAVDYDMLKIILKNILFLILKK